MQFCVGSSKKPKNFHKDVIHFFLYLIIVQLYNPYKATMRYALMQ